MPDKNRIEMSSISLILSNIKRIASLLTALLALAGIAVSHSLEYREVYRPHYRIVEKGIFECEIKPL